MGVVVVTMVTTAIYPAVTTARRIFATVKMGDVWWAVCLGSMVPTVRRPVMAVCMGCVTDLLDSASLDARRGGMACIVLVVST